MASICKNMLSVTARTAKAKMQPLVGVSGSRMLGSTSRSQDKMAFLLDTDLGNLNFGSNMAKQDDSMWHLVNGFQDCGQATVAADMEALGMDCGIASTQDVEAYLNSLTAEAAAVPSAASSSPGPTSMHDYHWGEAKTDPSMSGDMSAQIPVDYWQSYESNWKVIH